jgi:hypothetical protein
VSRWRARMSRSALVKYVSMLPTKPRRLGSAPAEPGTCLRPVAALGWGAKAVRGNRGPVVSGIVLASSCSSRAKPVMM